MMAQTKRTLYLFDFDGTLTHKDSLFDFLKKTQKGYYKGFILFLPKMIIAKLGIGDKGKTKEAFISYFLKDKSQNEIQKIAQMYFEENHQKLLRENAVSFIQDLPPEADKYMISASLDLWLNPFAEYLGMQRISTEGAFENGEYTGKFSTPNCNYEEKARRILQEIDLSKYTEIKAYGDTKGDHAMYALADQSFHQYFH